MNAYVSVVFKKLRNLRKRAARVDEIEALAKQGRELDESQMGALLGKDALLSLIKELESIHTSLLEIETSSPPSQSQDLEIAKAVEEKLRMEGKEVEGVTKPSDGTNFDGNSGSEKMLSRQNMSDIQERIRMVVLLLQVGANFTSQTGKPMPPEVEYFYSLIHGKASVSDFTATIEQSLKCAGMFIFPEKAVGVNVLGGVTYDQLLAKVKSMAIEMGWQDPSVVNPDHAHSTAFDSIEGAEERKEPGGGVESRDSLGSARLSGNGNDRRKPKTKATSKRGQSVALKEGIEQDAAQAKEDGEKENETYSSKALQNDEEVAKIAEQRHAHNFEGSAVIEGIDVKRGEDSASNGADTLSGASPVAQNNKERVKRARGTRGGRKSNSKGKQKNDDNTNVSQTGSLTPSQTQRENKKKVNKSANASTSKSSKETDICGEGKGQREKVFGDKGGGDDASSSMKQPGAKSGTKSGKDPVGESGNATTATAAAAAEGQVRISASAIKRRRGKKTTDGQGRGQGTAPSTGKTTPDTAKAAQKDSTSPKA